MAVISCIVTVWNADISPSVRQPDVHIYLDGRGVGNTGVQGNVAVSIPDDGKNHEVSASYPGLVTGSTLIRATTSLALYLHTDVAKDDPVTMKVVTNSPPAGINATIVIFDHNGSEVDTTNTDPNGNATSNIAPVIGDTYRFDVTLDGYQPYSKTVVIQSGQVITLGPLVLSAPDLQGLPPAPSFDSASSALDVQPTAPQLAAQAADPGLSTLGEFIYPNSSDGKYFTTTQARMYIGDVFIDEFDYVQFALQDNKVPIYPYNARYFAAMGQGRSLVQGQLGINLVSEGYLALVLTEYLSLTAGQGRTAQEDAAFDRQDLLTKLQLRRQEILSAGSNASAANAADLFAINQQITSIAVDGGPAVIDNLRTVLSLSEQQGNSQTGDWINPCYLDVPFDIVISMSGAGRTVTRKLEKCFLIGNEQVMDQSGQVLKDGYGFIARRLQ